MPLRLRPSAAFAPDAILVGDPGRALLLAQELLEAPKMANHARGLWGYSGTSHDGRPLSIQSTGMGGASAAVVLGDLAELGVRRAVRVGTCSGLPGGAAAGELLLVTSARAQDGAAAAHGAEPGARLLPDPGLLEALRAGLPEGARAAPVVSFDVPAATRPLEARVGGAAADMQTATLFARAGTLGLAIAALLVVETDERNRIDDDALAEAAKTAGTAAAAVLST